MTGSCSSHHWFILRGIHRTSAVSLTELWYFPCCLSEQVVQQTVDMRVISVAMTLTRCHSNVMTLQWAIMIAMASQITGVSMVCSAVSSGADQRTHQSSASIAFVREIHRWPVNSAHKGPVTRKMFHLMTSSWNLWQWISLYFPVWMNDLRQNVDARNIGVFCYVPGSCWKTVWKRTSKGCRTLLLGMDGSQIKRISKNYAEQ